MKVSFKTAFWGVMALLMVLLCWSVWEGAAQTNAPAVAHAPGTNEVSVSVQPPPEVTPRWVEHLAVQFPVLKTEILYNEVWKYLVSLVYIFLAFYLAKFLDYLTRVWIKKWSKKTNVQIDSLVLNLLNGPVKVVVFVIFLHIGLQVLQWPPKVQVALAKGFTVIVALSLTYMALKCVDLLVGYWHRRSAADADYALNDQLLPVLRKSLKVFVVVVAVLVTADNLEIKVTTALASLSIGGLAVGLAAQDTLANLFGAVAVFVDKPFRIGDLVRLEGVEGTVESIGVRSTRVRNLKGYLVTIPNKAVGNATITNLSRQPSIATEMNIGLAYDTSAEKLERALAILREIYGANQMIKGLLVTFNTFKESSLNLQVTFAWTGLDAAKYSIGMEELNLKVKQRFDKEGIHFAFPTRTLYLKQEPARTTGNGDGPATGTATVTTRAV